MRFPKNSCWLNSLRPLRARIASIAVAMMSVEDGADFLVHQIPRRHPVVDASAAVGGILSARDAV